MQVELEKEENNRTIMLEPVTTLIITKAQATTMEEAARALP